MARLINVHEYELKPGTDPERFEQTLRDAEARGLFDLPGLISHHFVKGVKGARRDAYAAIWVYESRDAWNDCGALRSIRRCPPSILTSGGFGKISSCCQSSILTPMRSGLPRTRSYDSARRSRSACSDRAPRRAKDDATATGTAWERTPWHATQRAAWETFSGPSQ